MNRRIRISEGGSKYVGNLPLGCQLCMRGQKLVLFMGGICDRPSNCSWYCPISKKRRNSDQIYADEIAIEQVNDIVQEAKKIKALGCSFTGGDPLGTLDHRELTLFYLEELKHTFSLDFHTHLYTNGITFSEELAHDLASAGLNEIRFHPMEENFHKIEYALDYGMDVGAEIPVIPTPEYEEYIWNLIDYLDTIGANFINLNEFEMTASNFKQLKSRGFELTDNSIAAVKGSKEMAEKILKKIPDRYTVAVHFCPSALKDGIQVRNRYKRRAESIHRPYEDITEDGTLLFLRIKGNGIQLQKLHDELVNISHVPKKMLHLDLDDLEPYLDLPWFLSEENNFLEAINEYKLKGGIMEILPFRGENFEICEYTPLEKVHK